VLRNYCRTPLILMRRWARHGTRDGARPESASRRLDARQAAGDRSTRPHDLRGIGKPRSQAGVRTAAVVMRHPSAHDVAQVRFGQRNEEVQTLARMVPDIYITVMHSGVTLSRFVGGSRRSRSSTVWRQNSSKPTGARASPEAPDVVSSSPSDSQDQTTPVRPVPPYVSRP
jgi:hypothetical protein